MSGPGEEITQARGVASKGSAGLSQAQGAGRKAKAFGWKDVLILALFLLLGLGCGALSLFDPFVPALMNSPRVMLLITALGALLVGLWASAWLTRRYEGDRRFWPEFGLCLLISLSFGIGIALGHLFLPELLGRGASSFTWVIAPSCVIATFPLLLIWAYRAASVLEPRRYALWYYPKNYRERQHTWSRDRIVIANFHFKRKVQEEIITTVNVKLPEDAELGELVYLFIKDYNENRFPNSPITGLRVDDGSLGWVFRKPRYLLRKQRKWAWGQDILDPALTIAQNGITRDSDVFFERVFQERTEP